MPKYLKKLSLAAVLLSTFASSCATVLDGEDPADLAPADRQEVKSKVAYNPSGLDELVKYRRRQALEKIVEICGSNRYQIIKESDQDKDDLEDAGLAGFGADTLRVIEFQCQ